MQLQGETQYGGAQLAGYGATTFKIIVRGARPGDPVMLGLPSTHGNLTLTFTPYVTADDEVTVSVYNAIPNPAAVAGGRYRASVTPFQSADDDRRDWGRR